jgi:hypothetical protein
MKTVLFVVVLVALGSTLSATVLKGSITDAQSNEPIGLATIRVEGTSQAILSNEEGEYRLRLEPGDWQIRFSHVSYHSQTIQLTVDEEDITRDIRLNPTVITLPGTKVYDQAYSAGQRIILEAIARKQDLLGSLERYQFDAYTRLVIRDPEKEGDSAVMLVTETQLEAFWKQPDKYKEVILSRRQTANMAPQENLVTVGRILNFNANRLDLGPYSVVSPTAKDALDHYDYYLMDTVYIDSQAVFRLEVEPKNPMSPLFVGTIDIADSSYAVVGVDVGVSEGVETQFVENLRYAQRFQLFDGRYWMPDRIHVTMDIVIGLPFNLQFDVDYLAALHDYKFEEHMEPVEFDEFELEVSRGADDVDTATWNRAQLVPLTSDIESAYKRIDSLENAPDPLWLTGLKALGGLVLVPIMQPDIYRFSRVEGHYLGLGVQTDSFHPRWDLRLASGYAIDGEFWQHHYGFVHTLHIRNRTEVGLHWQDQIRRTPTLLTDSTFNYTLDALLSKTSPIDYYHAEGISAHVQSKVLPQTDLRLSYHHQEHSSVGVATDYSVFVNDDNNGQPRANPAIDDGQLRSIELTAFYDSRPLMMDQGRMRRMFERPYSKVEFGVEYSDPDITGGDYDFVRYRIRVFHQRRILSTGLTTLYLYGGLGEYDVPKQRIFTVAYSEGFFSPVEPFKTTGSINYKGDQLAAWYLRQDLGRSLWRRSGLPLIEDIPLSLFVYGGSFWTRFDRGPRPDLGYHYGVAPKGFHEIGFGLGNIPPLFFELYLTWQLSGFDDSHEFTVLFGWGAAFAQ